ncbi:hypothetical protein JAAARDRAFT_393061 [Jaapia argillacea MUCL 33604]|uniref:DNA mismatch repair proteins mutS family domain-containing protein n=1 Tax=Jaapia argillacea MUCL 33604 TaxID=933084 RepID=A0A067QJY9_9AGAM|nr:hypothetical protein JAAARDRAFT_393061 [Jaapia argillacea MUCL 33604]
MLSRIPRKVAPTVNIGSLSYLLRRFGSSRSAQSPQIQDPEHVSGTKVRKTRKKFSELPKTFINSDGTSSTPLGDWIGGLEELGGKRKGTTAPELIFKAHEDNVTSDSTLGSATSSRCSTGTSKDSDRNIVSEDVKTSLGEVAKTLRKPRKRKTVPKSSGLTDGTSLEEPTSELPKPTRKRKSRKTPLPQSDALPPPSTPLAVEILDNLARFPHCILLTRVGQFYESYFEPAVDVARLLNIKLTSRKWAGRKIPMCGFPIMHLDKHLKTLVQQNQRFVAMCEEFLVSPTLGPKGGFTRRVARVITPGTLIDELFLNPYENNYLLAVGLGEPDLPSSTATQSWAPAPPMPVGLAWIDVSTGEFFTNTTSHEGLRDELARIGPREVVLDNSLDPSHPLYQVVAEEGHLISRITPSAEETVASPVPANDLASANDVTSAETLPVLAAISFSPHEANAINLLTSFLHGHLLDHMPQLSPPNREAIAERMHIDAHTIKALEIREGMREGGTTGSLLSVIKRTVTSSGTRLLARWLCSPSTSLVEINTRQSLVAFFHSRPGLREDLAEILTSLEDATRIVQRFLLGRGDIADLSTIPATISSWSSIKSRIQQEKAMELQERGRIQPDEWESIDALMGRLTSLADLSQRIATSLKSDHGISLSSLSAGDSAEGENPSEDGVTPKYTDLGIGNGIKWNIDSGFSEHLQKLHNNLDTLVQRRARLERDLQREYDAPSLTLRSSPGQGMFVHIARAKRDLGKIKDAPQFISISASGTTKSFFLKDWAKLGSQILDTTMSIDAAQREAFETLRGEVNASSGLIRRNARIVDELDVTLGFAALATELNFVRPTVRDDMSYHVVNGRHPTVELGLLSSGRMFTPNTLSFDSESRLHIITGPNMAGKSTLLRQTALIAILAQTGSYVPADAATTGIVDRLFSRVGAKDDLFRDRSTFMVEMLETAEILRRATPRSLVIMDEVGRGTTMKDGLAIAFGTVHHLHSINRCRGLFATHFHELADLLGYSDDHKGKGTFSGVSFFCTDVDETADGLFAYSHRLRPGLNRDSHGLKVAQLAGMPAPAVAVAQDALRWLKTRDNGLDDIALRKFGQTLSSSTYGASKDISGIS